MDVYFRFRTSRTFRFEFDQNNPMCSEKTTRNPTDPPFGGDVFILGKYKKNTVWSEGYKKLSDNKALGDHVFEHGYFEIKKRLSLKKNDIEFVVLLMANAATITSKIIDKGIKILRKNKKLDSAVSTSVYNMWSPLRARKLIKDGTLKPFVPFEIFGNPKTLNCDRDSQGNVYYADMSVSVVRPKCLENLSNGLLPQKWMGKRIAPIPSW